MTHILPQHPDLGTNKPASISSALEMEQQQQQQQQQLEQQQHAAQQHEQHDPQQNGNSASTATASRKRKKATSDGDEVMTPSEPRRLRRSHEACARCRSKKIKCDSKHPKCTACATAGVQCNQEDRHRKTLTPRGHVDRIERQLAQCEALLKRHYSGFTLDDLDTIVARENVEVTYPSPSAEPYYAAGPSRPENGSPGGPPKAAYGYPPHPHMIPPGYPPHMLPGYPPPPPGYPMGIPYTPQLHPAFPMAPPPPPAELKGQDPQSNDMSNDQSLAKSFGVSPQIVQDLKLGNAVVVETEDLAVGSGGLSSGRDRDVTEESIPRDLSQWVKVEVNSPPPGYMDPAAGRKLTLWLPKDRKMANRIFDVYFKHLNTHRPVFNRDSFEQMVGRLYAGQPVAHDPGFICGMYIVLALGTMSELNKVAAAANKDVSGNPQAKKSLMPVNWPEYEEFFHRALAIKPDLRVTTSSLQALILLHWYLYTERQQRSLWRLVGSLVRMAVELGLHHDPYEQDKTFTEEEAQLRIRLWSIVMIHDRGTSILLGRPLAISPADSNTRQPGEKNGQLPGFSEHFLHSAPVADIQADIVNSLYSPTMRGSESMMRHATRIIKVMVEFRKQLPDSYMYYFGGTEDWTLEQKRELVNNITEDQGLTLLKIGIARILLLRALFMTKELPYQARLRALKDAIVTSHNIIVIHGQMIKFPDIAFFVSPIPLHIAAMVLLFGQMSHCEKLPRETAIEDIWTALDMLPRFRWHWERRDMGGAHPLIERVAEKVLDIDLSQVKSSGVPVLIPEEDWSNAGSPSGMLSPTLSNNQATSPTHPHSPFGAGSHGGQYGAPAGSAGSASSNGVAGPSSAGVNGKQLADVPASWFWPMDPENPIGLPQQQGAQVGQQQQQPSGPGSHYQIGTVGCVPSESSYMLEEKDPSLTRAQGQQWVNTAIDNDGWRALAQYQAQAAHAAQQHAQRG